MAFNIGDRVRFKSYEEISDVARRLDGLMTVTFGFPDSMKHLCGTTATIVGIEYGPLGHASYILEPRAVHREYRDDCFVSADMLEPEFDEEHSAIPDDFVVTDEMLSLIL